MEFNFNSYDTSKQSISYCEVDKCKAVINLKEQLDQLKAENEQLKQAHYLANEILKTLGVLDE
jgi:FtsZ-binding cell division protein ZapB